MIFGITLLYVTGDMPVSLLHRRPVIPHAISAVRWSQKSGYVVLDILYDRHKLGLYHA